VRIRLHLIFFLISCSWIISAQDPYLDSLKAALKLKQHDTSLVSLYTELGSVVQPGEIDQYANAAIKICETQLQSTSDAALLHFYKFHLAMNLNNLGYGKFKRGDIVKALDIWQRCLDIHSQTKDKRGIAATQANIGNAFLYQGYYQKALEYGLKSLQCELEINTPTNIALAYNNIGVVYDNMGDYEKALDNYTKALNIFESEKNEEGISSILNNLGYLCKNQGELNKALAYHIKSLNIRKRINNKEGFALSLSNLGETYYKLGQTEKALDYYKQSLLLREELEDLIGISTSLAGIAKANFDLGQTDLAKQNAERCLNIASELSLPKTILSISELLVKISEAKRNFAEAYRYQELFEQAQENINSESTKKTTVTEHLRRSYAAKMVQDSIKSIEEKQLLNAQVKRERTFAYSLYIGLAILLIFSIFIYNRLRLARNQKKIIVEQKTEVENKRKLADERLLLAHQQKQLIEEKQNEILASIEYAKRIQRAMVTSEKYIAEYLKVEHFIYYKPKDIVSGDFYWATHYRDKFYLAVCDCTGHGVPGAFMSLLNILFLNYNILGKNITSPSKLLDQQRNDIIKALNPKGNENAKDGMDCVLCVFDLKNKDLKFSAANNPLWLIRNDQLQIFKGDKMPVGKHEEHVENFKLQSLKLQKGDIAYMFTDGFADQFGGPKNKKFKYSQLGEILLANKDLSLIEQKHVLERTIKAWQGTNEQVDDILIVGIKI
jgi:serine phosphatase RsbU (regulator of sigma subunit)/Tfp pilus assembly protein PilF